MKLILLRAFLLLLVVVANIATATAQDLRPLSFTKTAPSLVVGEAQICHLGFAGVDASFSLGDGQTHAKGKNSVYLPSFPVSQSQEVSFGCRFSYFIVGYSLLDQAYELEDSVVEEDLTWSYLALHLETVKAAISLEVIQNLLTLDMGVGHYMVRRQLGRLSRGSMRTGAIVASEGNLAFVGLKVFLSSFAAVEYEQQKGLTGELSELGRLGINFHVRF